MSSEGSFDKLLFLLLWPAGVSSSDLCDVVLAWQTGICRLLICCFCSTCAMFAKPFYSLLGHVCSVGVRTRAELISRHTLQGVKCTHLLTHVFKKSPSRQNKTFPPAIHWPQCWGLTADCLECLSGLCRTCCCCSAGQPEKWQLPDHMTALTRTTHFYIEWLNVHVHSCSRRWCKRCLIWESAEWRCRVRWGRVGRKAKETSKGLRRRQEGKLKFWGIQLFVISNNTYMHTLAEKPVKMFLIWTWKENKVCAHSLLAESNAAVSALGLFFCLIWT